MGPLLFCFHSKLQTEGTYSTSRPANLKPNQPVKKALLTFDCLFVLFLDLCLWKTVRVDAGFVFTWQETGLLLV